MKSEHSVSMDSANGNKGLILPINILCILVFFMLVTAASCSSPHADNEILAEEVDSQLEPTTTPVPSRTNTPIPTPTATTRPTNTATSSPTASVTPRPTATNTATPPPVPNGLVAYTYWDESANTNMLAVVNADGSNVSLFSTSIDSHPAGGSAPFSWSPDGTQLVFAYGDRLFTILTDGTGLTELGISSEELTIRDGFVPYGGGVRLLVPDIPSETFLPVWSPDGSHIAFVGYGSQIYQMDISGNNLQMIATTQDPSCMVLEIVWSPNSDQIAFSSQCGGLFVVPVHEPGEVQEIYESLAAGLSWSANGKQLGAYLGTFDDSNWEPYIFNLGQSIEIVNLGYMPYWSPDATKVAYSRLDQSGDTEIFVSELSDSEPRQLTGNDTQDTVRGWSPDGEWILYVSERDGEHDIYAIHVESLTEIQLTDFSDRVYGSAWLPN